MFEFCKCLYLTSEAFAASRRQPRVRQKFDRNQITRVFAISEPYHPHPALAQYPLEPVRTKFPKRHGIKRRADHPVRNVGQTAIQ